MKVPLSWLKDYVEIKEGPERIAQDLLLSGTKTETIEAVGGEPVFDFEITPNRADCLSVIGIAREVAAIYERKLTIPSVLSETQVTTGGKDVIFQVIDNQLCPYYSIGTIDSIKVGPSPVWLATRLEKSGIRSINNIVDVTNYVMLETGQPMHAFDADKIDGKMLLRASKEGEMLTTLDDIQRKLPTGSIVIEDSKKLIDLAGLMGGRESEVDSNTKTVILHVPIYDPPTIRRTSQALGLRTEASLRFEKQIDPIGHRFAFERAAELFRLLTQGNLASGIESVGFPRKERTIQTPISLIEKTLGIPLGGKQICNYLSRLAFATNLQNGVLSTSIPSFRTDITTSIDLVEEVGRLAGYNQFPKTLPDGPLPTRDLPKRNFEREVKQNLVSLGLKEIYSNTLTSSQVLEDLGLRSEGCLKVTNRLSLDYEYLRPSLFVGLLLAARLNVVNFDRFTLFEIGRVFGKERGDEGLPNQPKKVAAIWVNSTFTAAKGALEALLRKLGLSSSSSKFSLSGGRAPFGRRVASLFIGEKQIGAIGEVASSVLEKFDIAAPTFGFEIDLTSLENAAKETTYQPIPKYPLVKENLSLFLSSQVNFAAISQAVERGAGKNYYSLELLEDTEISNRRSILIGVEYYDRQTTLKKEKLETIRQRVLEELKRIGAEPRTKET